VFVGPAAWTWVLALVLLGGCAGRQVFVSDQYSRAGRVALLPMANETNDLDGPVYVRSLVRESLIARGFQIVEPQEVDAILKENGFTDGGQLGAAKPEDMGQWLKADTLFYTTLVEFNTINVGFYWQRKVTLAGRLVEAVSGQKLWDAQRTWMTLNVQTDAEKAKREFATQIAVQAVEKLTKSPLQMESRIAVNRLLDTLPVR